MKNSRLVVLATLLSMEAFSHADQSASLSQKQTEQKSTSESIQYHNRVILFPLHQGYERIKPNAFYVGIEGFFLRLANRQPLNVFFDAELRMGYNFFFKKREHFTPFAGIGYLGNFYINHHRSSQQQTIGYGTIGFLYTHEFSSMNTLGLNGKCLIGDAIDKDHLEWESPVIGVDIAIPYTFRFGLKKHWDYRIEPFNLYLHSPNNCQNIFGFRSSLGYRF